MGMKVYMSNDATGSYENIAHAYAKTVDEKPIHVYYERPHLWSLIPENLANLKVLDVGCGSGWHASKLQSKGAHVTALDASAKMVELTKARLQNKCECHVADLEKPLPFLKDKSFDHIIAPLVIHYVKDWAPMFQELGRVLKKDGTLTFSTHQPQTDVTIFKLDNYFTKTLLVDNWPNIGEVRFYHHTLHELGESLYKGGFVIERLLEPLPLEGMKEADPQMYAKVTTQPWLLFIRARKV
jgi:ubiquinone/menaquinone biosynthesis C-methylase UbiE